jgi:hypothetical protein
MQRMERAGKIFSFKADDARLLFEREVVLDD